MTSEGKRTERRDGAGEEEESVICECLVQLSAVAELQEAAGLLASINNALSGVQRGRENERRGGREYAVGPQGQT